MEFTQSQKHQIKRALRDYLHIKDEAVQNVFVASIEESGTLRAFGFGSLLSYSHLQEPEGKFKDNLTENFPGLETDKAVITTPAKLTGYQRDFVCFDIVYRGTPEKPGITMGLDKNENSFTPGGILETRIDQLDPNIAANFVEYYLKKFGEREMPPNMPIYTFGFLNIETKDGRKVPSLACIADPEGPLYIHNEHSNYAEKNPDLYKIGHDKAGYTKKVHIMATALNPDKLDGSAKTKGAITDLDCLRNVINDSMAKGIMVETRFHRLFADAIIHRMKLGGNLRETMQAFERDDKAANTPELLGDFMVAVGAHNQKVEAALNMQPPPAPAAP